MKERYVKPEVYIESFALSQTIARNCGYSGPGDTGTLGQYTYREPGTCVWDLGGWSLFSSNCNDDVNEYDPEIYTKLDDYLEQNYGVCYNNPSGAGTIFSSG